VGANLLLISCIFKGIDSQEARGSSVEIGIESKHDLAPAGRIAFLCRQGERLQATLRIEFKR
jgi:hypothetical protein